MGPTTASPTTASPTTASPTTASPTETQLYPKVGDGICRDSTGAPYDWVNVRESEGCGYVHSFDNCAQYCLGLPSGGPQVWGFEFSTDACFCRFEDGGDDGFLAGACKTMASFIATGSGAVASALGDEENRTCYKYNAL